MDQQVHDEQPKSSEGEPTAISSAANLPAGGIADPSGDARSRLLSAAGPVFAHRGFRRATVREICAAANVNIAAVGYYFGDKLGLYREVVRQIRESRQKASPIPAASGVDVRADLFQLIHTLLSQILACDAEGWESELMMREMQNPTPVLNELVNESFQPMFERLRQTIQLLMGGNAPEHVVDQLTLTAVGQCVYYRVAANVVSILIPEHQREKHYDVDSLSRHVTSVILSATENGKLIEQKCELDDLLATVSQNRDLD